MNRKSTLGIIVVGIIAGVLSYWFNGYNQITAFGISIYLLLAIGSFIGSFILSLIIHDSVAKTALLVSAGVILAISGRVIFDLLKDPSSHNLFPFEMLISFAVSFPCSFVGSFLASLYEKRKNR
jgi:hypothetical protein